MPVSKRPIHRSIADVDRLVTELLVSAAAADRFVLGIAGPPGAGKSTLAATLVSRTQRTVTSCVAPMDGFHRSNEELDEMGLLALKGVPESFDADAFVEHLAALRTGETVHWPTFDRSRETVVPGGQAITPSTRLIVVEGNYLLLDTPPWDEVRRCLDEVWYLDVDPAELTIRLRARHARYRSPADARVKMQSTDLPNAALVAPTRSRADVVLTD